MSDWRKELVEKMAREISRYNHDTPWQFFIAEARAVLAVAEPVIREQCAKIADKTPCAFNVAKDMNTIAAAIREKRSFATEGGRGMTAEEFAAMERRARMFEAANKNMRADNKCLREENARLREALAPFVDAGHLKVYISSASTKEECWVSINIKNRDLRAAAAAIREGERDDI